MSCILLQAVHGVEELAPASGTARTRHGQAHCGGGGVEEHSTRDKKGLFERGFKEGEFGVILFPRYLPCRMSSIIRYLMNFVKQHEARLKLLVKIKYY